MKTQNVFMYALAMIFITGFFVLLGILIFIAVPVANAAMLNLVVGALIGCVSSITGYYWGSSKSSENKNDTINTLVAASVVPTSTTLTESKVTINPTPIVQ